MKETSATGVDDQPLGVGVFAAKGLDKGTVIAHNTGRWTLWQTSQAKLKTDHRERFRFHHKVLDHLAIVMCPANPVYYINSAKDVVDCKYNAEFQKCTLDLPKNPEGWNNFAAVVLTSFVKKGMCFVVLLFCCVVMCFCVLHTCTHAPMHPCTHAPMHTCTHARMHACTHAHMYVYT